MEQEEKRKQASLQAEEKTQRKDYWLHVGIVVKVIHPRAACHCGHALYQQVMNKKLGDGRFYKLKGVVKQVIDKYVGLVEMDDTGTRIQV